MVLDILMLLEIGLVVAAAALAKLLYIAFFLDSAQDHQPYMLAGLAGGIVIHYMMRLRGLHEPAAILGWRRRLGELVVAIGLSFLIVIALAYLLKISSDYSRGWLLTWAALVTVALPLSRPLSASLLHWLASTGYTARRIAVVAAGPAWRRLRTPWQMPVYASSACSRRTATRARQIVRHHHGLINIGQRNQIDDRVALSDSPQSRTARLVDQLSVLPVDVCCARPSSTCRSCARRGSAR
jgi:putative colanic acid biosynthesis UDP-glucose lipid carrier transferase